MAVLRVGLTGGIASGKSTVAQMLAEHGAVVIDADLIAREVVAQGTAGLRAVVARFGDQVLTSEGHLDRKVLGAAIFGNPEARRDLEAIVHPLVRRRAAELEDDVAEGVVVQMIPLLVETGQQQAFDVVVVVDLPEVTQRERLADRDHFSADEITARLAAQASRGRRLQAADLVVDNSSGLDELAAVAREAWRVLVRRLNAR